MKNNIGVIGYTRVAPYSIQLVLRIIVRASMLDTQINKLYEKPINYLILMKLMVVIL